MGLERVLDNGEKLDQILARLQPRPKLAPVPPGVPMGQSWHTVRDGVVDRVCDILDGNGGPAVAALTGRSGAGKTTAAAAMVGERHGPIRPRVGETEEQARTRLDRVRARFSDGVVYLRVGQGAGAADRLPPLMRKLAKALHEDVMKSRVDAPEMGEAGESYVKKIVEQESLRCLVVADDVWEEEVVEKLRETGMWVLLTTRTASMVEPGERVVMDKLGPAEAEGVLRGAARLPPGHRLCDDAMKVLEICGYTAMDIAFVGSWSSVRTIDNCAPKSSKAWVGAVAEITGQMDDVRGQAQVENADATNDLDINRLAVLRTGFKYLARADPLAQDLYVALAVFPDGHSFQESDAGVLLDDKEAAAGPISILERWGVLRADASEKYRMHDAHVEFARDKLMVREDVRNPSVDRWTSRVSRLDYAINMDLYELRLMWRALENVGGEGWWASRPYDDQLVRMDASNPSKILAVHIVGDLYVHVKKYDELHGILTKVLKQHDDHGGGCPEVQMAALCYVVDSLHWQGRYLESKDVELRLGELVGPGVHLHLADESSDSSQISTLFCLYGICSRAARCHEDAEAWFRKAVQAQESGGGTGIYQMCWALHELGELARKAGRLADADLFFQRALKIKEAKLGPDDVHVLDTLFLMTRCARDARRLPEEEELLERALMIQQVRLGPDDLQVAVTLREMARCAGQSGRWRKAEGLVKRALEIEEAKLGPDDLQVAVTLQELVRCKRKGSKLWEFRKLWKLPGEVEALLKRALEIKEANLGPDDLQVAVTLREMSRCARLACLWREAEASVKRALEIEEAKLGPDDLQVAATLHSLGLCVGGDRRRGEAEALFRRALEIKEAKLGPNDLQVAVTLHDMGRCVRDAGRPGDAEALFQRALEIEEAKLGAGHVDVAWTQKEIRWCAWEVKLQEEAN